MSREVVPVLTALTPCVSGGVASCADGDPARACPATEDPLYTEFQGKLRLPVFQEGQAPYTVPAQGGAMRLDDTGTPVVVGQTDVCFALTVPKVSSNSTGTSTSPPAGFPLVVYGHGTGGHFRRFIENGLARALARGPATSEAPGPMAMLSFDAVLHGPRKGLSVKPTAELLFNLLNPKAARDNLLSAAADLHGVGRWLDAGG